MRAGFAPANPALLFVGGRRGLAARPAARGLLQAFVEGLEQARARRVAEFAERLGLDLADALARHVEVLADLFERVLLALRAEAVAQLDDDLFARAEGRQHLIRHLPEVGRHD